MIFGNTNLSTHQRILFAGYWFVIFGINVFFCIKNNKHQ